ncbi:MAG: Unknown protein [uncultured Aureispira sp.]|uniref:Uncharacterized protein n=1 Tax=uncultured Aureispira sp. TaxID=1331704 RepID=A0A6S6S0E3_9BACT|nr:MAG: Unknown protein [uncultured Aureispira sp.]
MRLITFFFFVLAISHSLEIIAQTKSQKALALDLESGKYTFYSEASSSIGEAEIKPMISSSTNTIIAIAIDRSFYRPMKNANPTWSSGFADRDKENYLWIPDDGKSIVLYELDANTNTVLKIKGYYGKTEYRKIKAAKNLINKYLAIGKEGVKNDPKSKSKSKSQKLIALSLKPGAYTLYSETGKSIGKAEIKAEVSEYENIVTAIEVDQTYYKAMGSLRYTWSSGFAGRRNKNCLWIPDDAKSIVLYELDPESNTVLKIKGYYSKTKPTQTETKTTAALINECLAIGQKNIENDPVAQAKIEHKKKYSIEGKEIVDLKIEIISEDENLDCGSVFQVGVIVKTADGTTIKSHNLGGTFYEHDFEISTLGASSSRVRIPKSRTYVKEFTVKPYCESFNDNKLKVYVVARDKKKTTKIFETKVNCVPDPAVAAAKAEAERNQKFWATETLRSEPGTNTIVDKVKSMDIQTDFLLETNLSMEVMGGFMGKKSYHLVGGKKYQKADYPGLVVNYKNIESGKESMDASKKVNSYGSLYANAGTETEDGKLLLAANHVLYYTDDVPTVHNSYLNKELNFTAIQDLGNGKCVALASTTYSKTTMNHFASRKGLKLIIWDYKNGKEVQIIDLSSKKVSAKPQLLKTADGNFIISFDEFEEEYIHNIEKSYVMSFSSAKTRIYKASIQSGTLTNLWGRELPELNGAELTDLIEARNGDIVFVLKGEAKRHESPSNNRNISSFIYLASMKANGSGFKYIKYDHLGHNKLRGNKKPMHSKYIYMGAVGRPFLLENPKGPGYIVVHRPSLDVLKSNVSNTEKFQDFPSFVTHNAATLQPEIIDILDVSASSKHYQSTHRPYSTDPYTSEQFEIKDVHYNPVADQIILVEEGLCTNDQAEKDSRYKGYSYDVGRVYLWGLDYSIFEVNNPGENLSSDVAVDRTSSQNNNDRGNASNMTSSSSSSSSPKLVQVYIDPNKKGNATVKIYWTQDGQNKKFAMSNTSRKAIGYIPEGTKLSYSSDVDHNKKIYFYTVPSGKSSVSVTLQ